MAPTKQTAHDTRALPPGQLILNAEPPPLAPERVLVTAGAGRDATKAASGASAQTPSAATSAAYITTEEQLQPGASAGGDAVGPKPMEAGEQVRPCAKARPAKAARLTLIPATMVRRPPMNELGLAAALTAVPARTTTAARAAPRVTKSAGVTAAKVPRACRAVRAAVLLLLMPLEPRPTYTRPAGRPAGPPTDALTMGGALTEADGVAGRANVLAARASEPAVLRTSTVRKALIPKAAARVPPAR